MIDFRNILNAYKGRQRSLLAMSALCFLAFIMVIGVGLIKIPNSTLTPQPPPDKVTTGKDLINKAISEKFSNENTSDKNSSDENTSNENTSDKNSSSDDKEIPKEEISTAQNSATEVNESDSDPAPQDSILNSPWPPSQDPNAPRVESTFGRRLVSMTFMLGITCVLAWLGIKFATPWINKFTGQITNNEAHINILERKALGPDRAVILLEADGRKLLLGMTEKSITSLADWGIPEKIPTPEEEEEISQEGSPSNEPKNLVKDVINKHISALPFTKIHK
ncbi:flagellar biosynthetic protein FliO [bacterium]|nr:flagellar biosynthetic protein FliO [bacterium]